MSEVKRYDAVHIRYEDNNIRYGEGCEVEVVTARDYDALRAENAELKRDAVRYRFARALANDSWMINTLQRVSSAELDSAIDEALAKHRGDK